MNIASPKEKKRYLLSTAILYDFKMYSLEAKADTNITNVLFGKWKLVIKPSTALNLYPG